MKPFLAALATTLALALAAPASAVTVKESDMSGGSFSSDFRSPTVLAQGTTGVTGTGAFGRNDLFLFNLPAGAQTLTFSFTVPGLPDWSYSAGGTILTSTSPFRWAWDGARASQFQLYRWKTSDTVTLDLGPAFAGKLYVGLYFTHGRGYSYRVSSNAAVPAPSVVPLPATGLLLLTALGGAALAARRRRA